MHYSSHLSFTLKLPLFCLALFSHFCAADDGMDILSQMSTAADALDYSGEFVYVKDGMISSMKIVHLRATENSASQQKLMALDGSMREIIQQDDVVACVLPDQGMGVREKRQARQLFKLNLSEKLENIIHHYTVESQGTARVANRDCSQLSVKPKDAYRYGYSLCVDIETRLLLSSELNGTDDKPLESYRFVSVNFGQIDSGEINSRTPAKTLNWMDDEHTDSTTAMQVPEDGQTWKVSPNPTGFELEYYIERVSPVMQSDVTHLVLSDGLAQVSVFISPAAASANQSSASLNMGSLNSFTRKLDGNMITVVGEVPQETVKLIAQHTGLH